MYRLLLLFFVLNAASSFAVIETYIFKSPQGQQQYDTLIEELRCPKCQNQNLSGSNSPIAKDLRKQVFTMIEAGNNKDEITQFMVKRYGNFVRYEPPLDVNTIVLWGLPFFLLFVGGVVVVRLQRSTRTASPDTLTQEEEKALKALKALLDRKG